MATNHSDFAVYVADDKGKQVCVLPGDLIPAWAEKSITNPYVLGATTNAEGGDDGDPQVAVPPQAGAGSGRDTWADYAEQQGVTVNDDWKRDQIIDACKKAGVAVE